MINKRGFTLIELLVVIAIIGLLSTLAVVALSSARQKARDAKRLADLKNIETGLEFYYNDNNAYPGGSAANLGSTDYKCLDTAGYHTLAACAANAYLPNIPVGPSPSEYYVYTAASSSYSISATLEGSVSGLSGAVQLRPGGIVAASAL